MHLSGSNIKLVVSPDVPHDIIDDTFEGALIRRMVGVLRTKDGYEVWSNSSVENAVTNLDELLELAKESDSRLAEAALPLIEKAIADREYLFLDELGTAVGLDILDIADVLQELCRMYPDRIDHFAIAWSETTTSSTPEFGRTGGGADFITAEGIESVNAKTWLDEKREALARSKDYQPGDRWRKQSGAAIWHASVPHDNWVDSVGDEGSSYFEVEKIEFTLRGTQYKVSYSLIDTPRYFPSPEEAFAAGDEWYKKVCEGLGDRIVESMGLPVDDWRVEGINPLHVRRVGGDISMSYLDGIWLLQDGNQDIAEAELPEDLLPILAQWRTISRA